MFDFTRTAPDLPSSSLRTIRLAVLFISIVLLPITAHSQENPTQNSVWTGLAQGLGLATWISDLAPITPEDWNHARAGHLLERAGFGGTPDEIAALAAMRPRDAVHQIVRYQLVDQPELPPFKETGIYPSPEWGRDAMVQTFAAILYDTLDKLPPDRRAAMMDDARIGLTAEDKRIALTDKQAVVDKFYFWRNVNALELVRAETWLADRVLKSKRPLEDKLLLFWHDHFATSDEKVRDYRKMLAQFEMLREYANGNLRDLLIGAAKDPAMLVYLDNRQNLKGHPNENFAREIFELFSLGVGNYTETDIKEAARAFTGWTLDANGNQFVDRPDLHDDGEKTLLGRTGNFNGEDVVDIILEQPATARYISGKLYRYFVREDLSEELNDQLAQILRDCNYEIAPFLERVFLSRDFYSPASYATQIKGPVQLVISTYKKLGLTDAPTFPNFARLTAGLGEHIFYPPNVSGWDGDRAWINPSTIFQRQNVARYILFPEEVPVNESARLEGSRRLSGDFIHDQFLAWAAKGDYTSFPAGSGDMGGQMMGGGTANEVSKLSKEDFNLFRGVFNAAVNAPKIVPDPPRKTPAIALVSMIQGAHLTDVHSTVEYLLTRFLRVPVSADRQAELDKFLVSLNGGPELNFTSRDLETHLREVLHLIMSLPEYQLA